MGSVINLVRSLTLVVLAIATLFGAVPLRATALTASEVCCDRGDPCERDDRAMRDCAVACSAGCVTLPARVIVVVTFDGFDSLPAHAAAPRFLPGVGAPPATPPLRIT